MGPATKEQQNARGSVLKEKQLPTFDFIIDVDDPDQPGPGQPGPKHQENIKKILFLFLWNNINLYPAFYLPIKARIAEGFLRQNGNACNYIHFYPTWGTFVTRMHGVKLILKSLSDQFDNSNILGLSSEIVKVIFWRNSRKFLMLLTICLWVTLLKITKSQTSHFD